MKKGKISEFFAVVRKLLEKLRTLIRVRFSEFRTHQTAEYGEVEANSKRITMESVTSNFLEVWGFGNKNIFVTIGHLFWRPGYMMRDYLEGRRGRLMQPVMMLVVLTLGLMLLGKILPVEIMPRESATLHFSEARAQLDSTNPNDAETLQLLNAVEQFSIFMENIHRWEEEHPDFGLLFKFSITMLLMWLLFRKAKEKTYNFAEIMTVVCYAICQLQVISIVWLLCTAWWHPQISFNPFIFPFYIAHIVFFIDFQQLFQRRWWSTLWRTIVALIFVF